MTNSTTHVAEIHAPSCGPGNKTRLKQRDRSMRSKKPFCPRSSKTITLHVGEYRLFDQRHATTVRWTETTCLYFNLIYMYRVFQKKSSPSPKTFWNIITLVKYFCVKFCRFVGNSYLHIPTNFCRFIVIFHQMALIFFTSTHNLSSFE